MTYGQLKEHFIAAYNSQYDATFVEKTYRHWKDCNFDNPVKIYLLSKFCVVCGSGMKVDFFDKKLVKKFEE